MKITNVFVGTVGQDPRTGAFDDGRAWANVRIAVNHDYFNGATGEVVNRGVSWFDVSAYGALARNLGFSVRKGDSIIVVGELRLRDWEKEGRTGTSGTIIADYAGPNLLFGVAKYMRSSSLTPDAPDGADTGEGSGTPSSGAWGGMARPGASGDPDSTAAPGDGSASRDEERIPAGVGAHTTGAGGDAAAADGDGTDDDAPF